MNYRVKGYAANPLIVGLVVVGVAVVGFGVGYYVGSHKGGLGDGSEMGIVQEETVFNTAEPVETEAETVTEPPSTEPVTENLSYIRVVVSGNDYIYKGEIYTLEAFLGIVRANSGLPVRISKNGASMRAYTGLTEALEQLHVEYVESNT